MRALLALSLLTGCLPDSACPPPGDSDTGIDTDTGVDTDTSDTDTSDTDTDTDTDTGPIDGDGDGYPVDIDCDDTDDDVHPDAPEVCADGTDQDCDGADPRCGWSSPLDVEEVEDVGGVPFAAGADLAGVGRRGVATWTGSRVVVLAWTGDDLGEVGTLSPPEAPSSLGSPGDVTGDGAPDLVLAGMGVSAGDPSTVWVLPGPIDATATMDTALALVGGVDDGAGRALTGRVDHDGDGTADLVVGAPDAGPGTVYMLLGPVSAGALADARLVLRGDADGQGAGASVAGLDFDADGSEDLLVGARGAAAGAHRAWLVDDKVYGNLELSDARGIFAPGAGAAEAPMAVGDGGDLDGDGYEDVVLGSFAVAERAGRAWVVSGRSGRKALDLGDADAVIDADRIGAWLGAAVAGAGDADGDGFDDLLIGSPVASTVWLVHGPVEGTVLPGEATPRVEAEPAQRLGSRVAPAGDLDEDGFDESVLGGDLGAWVVFGGLEP